MSRPASLAAILALTAAPVAVHAQGEGILVDDPAACEMMIDVDPELYVQRVVTEAGAFALTEFYMSGPEVDSEFDKVISFDGSQGNRQISAGYCVSAERISPTVFVFETYEDLPGQVAVWEQGVDEPHRFISCGP